jgi:sugar phosphate isomerase/epimerase
VVENVPGVFSSVEALKTIFAAVPGLGFHLDVGHAFVRRNRFKHLLSSFGDRLRHLHLSDNRLRDDDHLPIGAGNIDWEDVIRTVKKINYDSTITLEVFSADLRYAVLSMEKVRELWGGS